MIPRANASPSTRAWGIAIAAGAILWGVTVALSGRGEPWDAPGYWSIAYPIAVLLSGALGYFFPDKPWRWAVTVIFMQLPVMILNGPGFGLLPLGLALLAVLSLPAIWLARLGARIRAGNRERG